MNADLIVLHPDDTVAIARGPLAAGTPAGDGTTVRNPVPKGHKLALRAVRAGEAVIKFGQPIGHASSDIAAGEHEMSVLLLIKSARQVLFY